MAPRTITLRQLFGEALEARAAAVVLRHLQGEDHGVERIWRPDQAEPTGSGRRPDFVFQLDGEPMAIEVVRLITEAASIGADSRMGRVQDEVKRRIEPRLEGLDDRRLVISFTYSVPEVLKLNRIRIGHAAESLADAALARLPEVRAGAVVPIELTSEPWYIDGDVRTLPGKPGVSFASSRPMDLAVEPWVDKIVRDKGDQHAAYAPRAILAVVETIHGDRDGVAAALRKREDSLPWWRIYLVDEPADSVELVVDIPTR